MWWRHARPHACVSRAERAEGLVATLRRAHRRVRTLTVSRRVEGCSWLWVLEVRPLFDRGWRPRAHARRAAPHVSRSALSLSSGQSDRHRTHGHSPKGWRVAQTSSSRARAAARAPPRSDAAHPLPANVCAPVDARISNVSAAQGAAKIHVHVVVNVARLSAAVALVASIAAIDRRRRSAY